MNRQHTHNALTTQKFVAAYFNDVKIEETRRQLFSDKKSPQRKSTPATIAYPVEMKNRKAMNTSRFLN